MAETPKNNIIPFSQRSGAKANIELGDNPDQSLAEWLDNLYDSLIFAHGKNTVHQNRRATIDQDYSELYEMLEIDFFDRENQFGPRPMLVATVTRDTISKEASEQNRPFQYRIIGNPSFDKNALVVEFFQTDENGKNSWVPMQDEQRNCEIELLLKSEEVQ